MPGVRDVRWDAPPDLNELEVLIIRVYVSSAQMNLLLLMLRI